MACFRYLGYGARTLVMVIVALVLMTSMISEVLAREPYDYDEYCRQKYGKDCWNYCYDKFCGAGYSPSCESATQQCLKEVYMESCKERFEEEGVAGMKLIAAVEDGYQCKCVDSKGVVGYCFYPHIFFPEDAHTCPKLGIPLKKSRVESYAVSGSPYIQNSPNGSDLYCSYELVESYGAAGGVTKRWAQVSLHALPTESDADRLFQELRAGYAENAKDYGYDEVDTHVLDRYVIQRTDTSKPFITKKGVLLYKEKYVITVLVEHMTDQDVQDLSSQFNELEKCCKDVIDGKAKKQVFGRAYLSDSASTYPYGALRNAKVELKYKGQTHETYTDDAGLFMFDVEVKKGDEVDVILHLEDKVDGKNYIEIIDAGSSSSNAVYIKKTCNLTDEHFRNGVNFDFNKTSPATGYSSESSAQTVPGLVKEYIIFEDAVSFALEELKASIKSVSIHTNDPDALTNCKAPPGYGDCAACCSPFQKIHMGTNYAKFWPHQNPGYPSPIVEFHEFGHHIMFSHKGYIPAIRYDVINHGGMNNQTTHDSLCEGEADFMALLMCEYKKLGGAKKYGIRYIEQPSSVMRGRNYEVNVKAWATEGVNGSLDKEDTAVATLLLDLYDEGNPSYPERLDDSYYFPSQTKVYDRVNLSLQDLWSVLKSFRCKNVFNLYLLLKNKYQSKMDDINNLFVAHAFFRDKDRGNGAYDGPETYQIVTAEGELAKQFFSGEPFHDKNNDGTRNPTEPFVDLGHGHEFPGGQIFNSDEDQIGAASNYAMFGTATKVGRQIGPVPENSYIYVENQGLNQFVVSVSFEPECSYYDYEYVANSHEGLVYIWFPPPEYEAKVTITPLSETSETRQPLEIESAEYFDLISRSGGQDHFLDHEFDLSPVEEAVVSGLTFESRSKPTGTDVQIPLTLNGIEEPIGNMDLTLGYDPSVLEPTEVIRGSLTLDSLFDHNILQDTIRIGLADSVGFTGDGSVAYVKCNVVGPEGSSCVLTIQEIAANSADDYQALDVSTYDGDFRVTGMEEAKGDCNGDGQMTAVDALCALQMAVGKKAEDPSMDINGDGKVSSLDARNILKIAVGGS